MTYLHEKKSISPCDCLSERTNAPASESMDLRVVGWMKPIQRLNTWADDAGDPPIAWPTAGSFPVTIGSEFSR
jgi:hypothetical protein